MSGTLAGDKKKDWKASVPSFVHAYDALRHGSTGYAPYRPPRLAIDAFLGFKRQHCSRTSPSEYMKKLEKVIAEAYTRANDAALRRDHKSKKYYDQNVRECKLMPGDRAIVRNVGLTGKHKLANIWEENLYVVLSKPDLNLPVFEVQREDGEGRKRLLHRNLLPFFF